MNIEKHKAGWKHILSRIYWPWTESAANNKSPAWASTMGSIGRKRNFIQKRRAGCSHVPLWPM